MKNRLVLYLLFVSFILAWGCSDDKSNPVNQPEDSTPRSDVPQQLAKDWYYGNISSVNFFNPNTGGFSAPSGVGMYFKFSGDGYYEKGVLLQSSLYGCTSTFYAFNKGTMVVEGNKIILYPDYGKIKSEDNCYTENNYEKNDEIQQEIMYWETGFDEYNSETLWLRYEEGDPSAFHLRE
jgi:hypothetical protein